MFKFLVVSSNSFHATDKKKYPEMFWIKIIAAGKWEKETEQLVC